MQKNAAQLSTWLEAHEGIAHTADVYRAGFTKYAVRRAVAAGLVWRTRRSWIYGKTCTRELFRAVQLSGRLTCISAARKMGLWVIDDSRLHIAVPPHAHLLMTCDDVRLHWGGGLVPLPRVALVDAPSNVLANVATCRPFEEAVVVFDSALRIGLITLEELSRLPVESPAFRRVCEATSILSDSGIESLPRIRLARIGIVMKQQVMVRGRRVDGLIGDRLVLQIDGGDHMDPQQRRKDIEHDARLQLMGYPVLRFDYVQIMFDWERVEAVIVAAIAQGLHLAK